MNLSNIVQVQNVNNKLRQSRRYEKFYNNYIVKSDCEVDNFYFFKLRWKSGYLSHRRVISPGGQTHKTERRQCPTHLCGDDQTN